MFHPCSKKLFWIVPPVPPIKNQNVLFLWLWKIWSPKIKISTNIKIINTIYIFLYIIVKKFIITKNKYCNTTKKNMLPLFVIFNIHVSFDILKDNKIKINNLFTNSVEIKIQYSNNYKKFFLSNLLLLHFFWKIKNSIFFGLSLLIFWKILKIWSYEN